MRVEIKCPYVLEKANPKDAGFDLKCLEDLTFKHGDIKMIDTGCQLSIMQEFGLPFFNVGAPNDRGGATMDIMWDKQYESPAKFGLEVQVRGRSGLAKKGLFVHLGTVDETYHSPIKVIMYYLGKEKLELPSGSRIAQLVFSTFLPVELIPVKEMIEDRGGFGSSGT